MSGVRAAQHAGPRRGFEGQGGAHLAFVFLPRSSAPERVKGRRDALPLAHLLPNCHWLAHPEIEGDHHAGARNHISKSRKNGRASTEAPIST